MLPARASGTMNYQVLLDRRSIALSLLGFAAVATLLFLAGFLVPGGGGRLGQAAAPTSGRVESVRYTRDGGTIRVTSAVGAGSTFTFRLPAL